MGDYVNVVSIYADRVNAYRVPDSESDKVTSGSIPGFRLAGCFVFSSSQIFS